MDSNGNFVVVWQDDKDNNDIFQIYARGFYSNATQLFEDMPVNSISDGQQYHPQVILRNDGSFVSVWTDDIEWAECTPIIYSLLQCIRARCAAFYTQRFQFR